MSLINEELLAEMGTNAHEWTYQFTRFLREWVYSVNDIDQKQVEMWFTKAIEAGYSEGYRKGRTDGHGTGLADAKRGRLSGTHGTS